ncbi:MAG: type II toxin-antitoxin system VapB family antitoxin [Actinomycetota bacterium]
MGLNIKNEAVAKLAAEVAELTGESKTEAIRKALEERRDRLASRIAVPRRRDEVHRFLEREIWPLVPEDVRRKRLTKREREKILGYGREGV